MNLSATREPPGSERVCGRRTCVRLRPEAEVGFERGQTYASTMRTSEEASVRLRIQVFYLMFALAIVLLGGSMSEAAQENPPMVRLSKLVIDVAHLESYKSALKEEVTASVRLEPGVLTLYAVFEKDRPTHVTILEIYADRAAYEQHIKSSHFLKYKTGTEQMVKSLDLIDAIPLVPEMKIK
jgi:quinol monooxygenase YgiN